MIRKTLLLLVGLSILSACAGVGGRPTYPTALTPEIQKTWNDAEALYQAKRFPEADAAYKVFIESFGYNEFTDDARFRRGEIRFQKKDYAKALELYRSSYANLYSPTIAPRAQFKAASSLYLLRRFDEARQELLKIRRPDASAVLRIRMDSLDILISRALKEPERNAMRAYLFLLDDYTDLGGNRQALEGVSDVISENEALATGRRWVDDNQVTSAEVAALPLKEYKGKRSGSYASYKYGKTLYEEGDFGRANKELRSYTSAYPKHEYYDAARSLLGEAQGRAGEAAIKVGLILPLSGKYDIYGESVLHGIECAVGVFAPCEGSSNVMLLVRDSEGMVEKAVAAVEDLASSDVIAIIGPILSATIEAAADRAQQLQVPLISLSQRSGITEIGDFIFRNTVTANSQVTTIVDYAVGRKKLKRFLVLYPQNEQGREYKDLFTDAVGQAGGKVVTANGYSSNRTEFATNLRGMSLGSEEGQKYDAIFIPDSFGPAGYIATTFATMGLESVPLLGISRWDDSRLISVGGKYVEGAVFPEAFFKKSGDPETQTFVSRFTQAYGIEPTLLEALGYDSMRMILETVKNGAARRNTVRGALSRLNDFKGVTGRISFNTQRDATRELPLLTVSGGAIRPLSK